MDIIHDEKNHKFYCDVDGKECVVEYVIIDGVIDFQHTYVPQDFRGLGMAKKIYDYIADWLTEQESQGISLKVKTSCSYADKYFNQK
jgi:predicted GNAT family acetyltransferase